MAGFPIFVELTERLPLVVGGGELAHIKARLLLKRADKVAFATDRPIKDISDIVAKGRAILVPARPSSEDIKGRPLVISATEDETEDARVFEIARELGVPVNVPDTPHLSTFSLGAIVDRGLVTVAIGTEGAAPVLATRVRAALERFLHPRLGQVAELARDFRARAAAVLPDGVSRRLFWERVFSSGVEDDVLAGRTEAAREQVEAALKQCASGGAADRDSVKRVGSVTLVGAGPGDPDLLTLKAVRALKSADVILTDFLVGDGVLEHARREARIVNVGKARGRHSRSQGEINGLIVAYAREGLNVVRLKGGDPFVFGRGGEEIDTLRASGIACDVVPGITAATAAAASLQIPLTHRDLARSVTFVSGHAAGDGAPDFDHLNFGALAREPSTLVAYMAVATAGALAQALIDAGWSCATPVVAVERASRETERRVQTTLDVMAHAPERLHLKGPALLICGEIAGLTPAGSVEVVASKDIEQTTKGVALDA